MNDSPIVTIREGATGYCDVVTSENGFQGSVIVSGVTRPHADAIAAAVIPALVEKLDRGIDAEIESLRAREDWSRPEHLDRAIEGRIAKRADIYKRAEILVEVRS